MSLFATATAVFVWFTGDVKIMAHENWQIVKEIFADALRQTPEVRAEFLDSACRDDKDLRREVESLLASFDSAENFMETPVVGEVTEQVTPESRRFSENQILGHYEIIGKIGAGGMGNVYLAQDLELQRRVALKVLRENFSLDAQAKQRLLREARAVAKLDHPNICAIYEISETEDCSFIVMQYVSGETLADILLKERLSAKKSCDLAMQIAAALEEAHSNNIIHRDIKPANIIVNNKGQLKVLDFGLAKFLEAETDEKATQKLSSSGAIMGTVPYMSPEQLRGETLDVRTDIFSFGVLFYEMLSGISPFQHDSNAESISAILNDQPDLTLIPFELRTIVQKSLVKDKTARYQTAKDFAEDLRNVGTLSATIGDHFEKPRYYFWKSSDSAEFKPETNRNTEVKNTKAEKQKLNYSTVFPIGLIILVLIGAAGWLAWQNTKTSVSSSFDDLRSVKLAEWKTAAGSSPYSTFRVSHDGKWIAYSSTQDGKAEGIYIKQTSDGADFRVTQDEWDNQTPVWSPDDRRIAFASFREGQSGIYVCPILGGQTTLLKIIGAETVSLVHWSKNGERIFYSSKGNLYRLDILTQQISPVIYSDSPRKDFFDFSPDEEKIVYTDKADGQDDLWIIPTAGGEAVRLTNDDAHEIQPRWHTDGERILYSVYRNKHYQINQIRANGGLPEQITRGESDFELIDISADGTRIYYLSWQVKSDIWSVNSENGEEFEFAGGTEAEFWSEVSPDGKFTVYQENSSSYPLIPTSDSSIVIKSLTENRRENSAAGYNPHWLPDSRRVALMRLDETQKKYSLWTINVVSGEEKRITEPLIPVLSSGILPNNRSEIGIFDWSPDGTQIVCSSKEARLWNILNIAAETAQIKNLTNNDNPNLVFYSPIFSPDGNFTVYISQQKPASNDEKPHWKIWLVKDGKPREIYSTNAGLRLLGRSADGEILAESTDGALKSTPLDVKLLKISTSGESKIITTLKNIYATTMTLSADGKTAAFTSRQDDRDNIFIADMTTGETKKLTANVNARLYYASPAFAPDGKTIFFDKQEEINTISMFENFK